MPRICVGQGPAAMVLDVPAPRAGRRITIRLDQILWAATGSVYLAVGSTFVLTGGKRTAKFGSERLPWFGIRNVKSLGEPSPAA